jgi:RNA polymerase sigma-70 factor (ECF subfamily)
MRQAPDQLIGWVGRHILPHERQLRRWLRAAFPTIDVDDVVQEAYCRIAAIGYVGHIDDPRQYLFRTARNVVLEQIRRTRVVRIDAASGLAELRDAVLEDTASPERVVAARMALARIEELINMLPERARQVFRMRKIEGMPQRDIAQQLGLTENIVENEVARGLRRILDAMTEAERAEMPLRKRAMFRPKPRKRSHDR